MRNMAQTHRHTHTYTNTSHALSHTSTDIHTMYTHSLPPHSHIISSLPPPSPMQRMVFLSAAQAKPASLALARHGIRFIYAMARSLQE